MTLKTRFEHRLSSGLLVRLDIRDSARFVMFETEFDEWKYATDGGTAFIARFRDRYFALTCEHVRGSFNWNQLVLTTTKFGEMVAGIRAVAGAIGTDAGVGTDISDMAIVELDDRAASFADTAYLLEPGTCCDSEFGDKLLVYGAQKAQSEIDADIKKIRPSFHVLIVDDNGPHPTDVTLRSGRTSLSKPIVGGVTGLSGAPVFNLSQGKLAGVMMRGGCSDGEAVIHYIEIKHYLRMVDALHGNIGKVSYPIG